MTACVCVALVLALWSTPGGAVDVWTSAADGLPAPNVSCWCAGYPNKTFCSWDGPAEDPPLHYTATYSERLRPSVLQPCQLIVPDSSSSRWHCHLPDLKLLTDYVVNVTAVYTNGSSSQLSSFMVEDVVRPDPPTQVQVSCGNLTDVLVRWAPPQTWAHPEIFPLKYEVLYHYDQRGRTRTKRTGPFQHTEAELKGLCPGRTYRFQVCAKDRLDVGQCSSWSSPVQVTVPGPS